MENAQQMKELLKKSLRKCSKEELVNVLAEIYMGDLASSKMNAMLTQQGTILGIDTSFAPCNQRLEILERKL